MKRIEISFLRLGFQVDVHTQPLIGPVEILYGTGAGCHARVGSHFVMFEFGTHGW